MGAPVVAIVGRPNVGKSTLLNRFIGRREAIVEERPGVTRDRKEVEAEWQGRRFRLVDTGGWMAGGTDLDDKVSAQAERAMAEADVVLLVVDVTTGATEDDARYRLLRRTGRQALVVANKVDDTGREADMWELLSLGLGEPHPVSALHGRGTGDLLDTIVALLPEEAASGEDGDAPGDAADDEVAVAIVGRPNVGKSTLFNRLIGEERAIVHDMPGTTRDTVDTVVETELGRVRLVDTAGMRRKSHRRGHEYYCWCGPCRRSAGRRRPPGHRRHRRHRPGPAARRAGRRRRCPIVVVLNKWEVLDAEQRAESAGRSPTAASSRAPVLPVTPAPAGRAQLFSAGRSVEAYQRRIPTSRVNEVLLCAGRPAGPAAPGPLRHAGPHRAAHLRCSPTAGSPDLPALPRAQAAQAFDLGPTPVAARPPARWVTAR